ncbi:MAG: phospho-N-acetylmuramoyl-pentapeptide-transferase [Acutalibacteraceae bacterium]|nr:phospho-N-acetylmuramoyl-pentapeptide-transferase [Acutalibacteraceae bacterium]
MSNYMIIIAAVAAFVISSVTGKFLIPVLHKVKFGQPIREEGPQWHQKKSGTPTMGGIMFIIASVLVAVGCYVALGIANPGSRDFEDHLKFYSGIIMAVLFGAIGFVDDYIKVVKKHNQGLTEKQKLVLQFLVAIAYVFTLFLGGCSSETIIPFIGRIDLGIFYWLFSVVLIVGFVNATNLTDGIDGLDGSVTFFASLAFMVIAGYVLDSGMSVMSASLAGACLGFLMWNFHPAKVFMGDTGSLFLGGFLCAIAYGMNMPVLIIPIGLVYIIEMFSVILQVTYFKATHGKRLFKMSPIHHHFEMCGWSEVKIVVVFSIVTAVLGVLTFLSVWYTYSSIAIQ